MPNFTSDPSGVGAGGFYNDTTVTLALGSRVQSHDGRVYRWCKAGAADLVAGNAIQAAAPLSTAYYNMTTAAAAIGATSVTVTPGATAAAANLFSQGYLVIHVTPGNGYVYAVSAHPAFAGSDAQIVKLQPDDPIQVALTTSSKTDLIQHPYNNVIQTPVTTLTGAVVGGAPYIITAASNGWLQTWGIFAGLIDGTPAIGQSLSCPGAVAGGFAINSGTLTIVANTMVLGVDTKNMPILLNIAA